MPSTTLVLCDQAGQEVADLEATCTIRRERSRAMSVKPKLRHDDDAAAELFAALPNGIPQARYYRDGTLRFSGLWCPQRETAGEDDSLVEAEFRSPFARLERRFLEAETVYTGQDAGLGIAWDLIADQNALSATGLIQGDIDATVNRDRTYEAGKQVAEAVVQLTEVDGGFDFIETFLDPTVSGGALAEFNVHAALGSDRTDTVRFEYGPGTLANCLSVERTIELPVNRVVVIGGEGTVPAVAQDAASIAIYGRYMAVEQHSDVTIQSTLQEKADGLLQPDPIEVVTFEPDPATAPQPFDDYDVGDTAGFLARDGALQIDAAQRIDAFEIDIDENGNESAHRLEFGLQAVRPLIPVRRGRRIRFRDPERQ